MKVGDYVKTRGGRIAKIKYIENNTAYCDNWLWREYTDTIDFIDLENEVKLYEIFGPTANIIDLIEIGDIVNYGLIGGGMVLHKKNDEITTNALLFGILKNKDIKSVITREQIENNLYKLEED